MVAKKKGTTTKTARKPAATKRRVGGGPAKKRSATKRAAAKQATGPAAKQAPVRANRGPATVRSAPSSDSLEELRRFCLALPETSERLSHGEPTWFVRGKKTFVTYSDHHHDDRLAFWCAAPDGAQEVLVASDPRRFFRPPYVGHRGWLGVYLDVEVDWDLVADLVVDAYRVVAPSSLSSLLEHPPAG